MSRARRPNFCGRRLGALGDTALPRHQPEDEFDEKAQRRILGVRRSALETLTIEKRFLWDAVVLCGADRGKGTMDDRVERMAHYVVFRRHPSELGKTKLAKILLSADVMMFRRHGHTVSRSDHVVRRQHGPVPAHFFEAIENLKRDGKIIERIASTPVGNRKEFTWATEPDLDGFTGEEIAVLEEAAEWICKNYSAASVSHATHDALWEETPNGAEIPIAALAIIPGEITPEVMTWAEG